MDIEIKVPTVELKLGEKTVKVKQFLKTIEKSNMMAAIEEFCFDGHILDQAITDAVLNALIILNYTDLEHDFENKYELVEFYDYMEVNNYVSQIINSIPEIEYNALIGYYKKTIDDFNRFKTSGLSLFANVMEFGPTLMKELGEMSKEVNFDDIATLIDITSKLD